MATEFEAFAKHLEIASQRGVDNITARSYERVTVLGGGNEGRLLAALALSQNYDVTLFSAYGTELRSIRNAGGITLRGDGPVGTYQIDQESTPSIATTAELDYAVSSADLIFATGPVHKHRTYAMVLADHLRDGQTLVIVPARTFAAFETRTLLTVCGCSADITIVEAQTLPYWPRAEGNTLHLTAAAAALVAPLPSSRMRQVSGLLDILANAVSSGTVLQSSLSDGSGVVEACALMFGSSVVAGKKSLPEGAEPLAENQTLKIQFDSARVLAAAEKALQERCDVAAKFGVRNLPDTSKMIHTFAGQRFVSDSAEAAAILRDAVSGSLIPLQSVARMTSVDTPVTDSLITLAGALLGSDIAAGGRRLESLNIVGGNVDDVRKRMESLTRGE